MLRIRYLKCGGEPNVHFVRNVFQISLSSYSDSNTRPSIWQVLSIISKNWNYSSIEEWNEMKQIQNTDIYTCIYIQTYTHIFNFGSFCFKIAPCVKMEKRGEYSSIVAGHFHILVSYIVRWKMSIIIFIYTSSLDYLTETQMRRGRLACRVLLLWPWSLSQGYPPDPSWDLIFFLKKIWILGTEIDLVKGCWILELGHKIK